MNNQIQSACDELGVKMEAVPPTTTTREQFEAQLKEEFKKSETARMKQIANLEADLESFRRNEYARGFEMQSQVVHLGLRVEALENGIEARIQALQLRQDETRQLIHEAREAMVEVNRQVEQVAGYVLNHVRNGAQLECKSQSKV